MRKKKWFAHESHDHERALHTRDDGAVDLIFTSIFFAAFCCDVCVLCVVCSESEAAANFCNSLPGLLSADQQLNLLSPTSSTISFHDTALGVCAVRIKECSVVLHLK